MQNQHNLIKGYRDLTQAEIDLMNEVKAHAEVTRDLINRVEQVIIDQQNQPQPEGYALPSVTTSPLRWLSEGRTDLQKGFMCLVRSIAQPTTF